MKQKHPINAVLLTLGKLNARLIKAIHRDRDWLWLKGDYREAKTTRETLKKLGFRFSKKGRELPDGETAHWYCACLPQEGKPAQVMVEQTPAVRPAKAAVVNPDLQVQDAVSEFAAMFPSA